MRNIAITPLLERHVEEAAFRWQQRDQAPISTHVKFRDFCHVDQLLYAHILAIINAGDAGWEMAWDALRRWRGAGEVFVCTVLAMQHGGNEKRLDQILNQVTQQPEYRIRSLISALLWCNAGYVAPLIDAWTKADACATQQVAAWRSVARSSALSAALASRPDFASRLVRAMQHPDPRLRAAACRAGSVLAPPQRTRRLPCRRSSRRHCRSRHHLGRNRHAAQHHSALAKRVAIRSNAAQSPARQRTG